LNLAQNELTGTIPGVIFKDMTRFSQLLLPYNRFMGTIPSELADSDSLVNLDLENNRLTGTIQPHLGTGASIDFVRLQENALTGRIEDWSQFIDLSKYTSTILYYYMNGLNDGSSLLDREGRENALTNHYELLYLFDKTAVLHLHNNHLSGRLPTVSMIYMTDLTLSTNSFTGTIPTEFGDMIWIGTFHFVFPCKKIALL
jgi:hypothetical protein